MRTKTLRGRQTGAPSLNGLKVNCRQVSPPAAPDVDDDRLLHAPCWKKQATSDPEPWNPIDLYLEVFFFFVPTVTDVSFGVMTPVDHPYWSLSSL